MNHTWPNFFIVGAARSGTTSLHNYLSRVSGICMSSLKEPNFFVEEVGPLNSHRPHIKEAEKYLSLFQPKVDEIMLGESSVAYLYDSKAPHLIQARIPNARILIILRDPIDRAYSHFLHHLRYGLETNSDFFEAIKKDYYSEGKKAWGFSRLYVELGMYASQIQRYLDLFDRRKVRIIIYEDEFKLKTKETVQDIVRFLGLEAMVPDEVINKVYNKSSEPDSGSFAVQRFKGVTQMNKMVASVRKNNAVLTNLTYPITSLIWRKFLVKNAQRPALTEKATQLLLNLYREDVEELCKSIPKTPSWSKRYFG